MVFRLKQLVMAVAAVAGVFVTACGSGSPQVAGGQPSELRLGYYANLTHAPALIGVHDGYFQQELGSVKLKTNVFNAGPDAVTALLSDSIDATYVGPNPAINAFVQSHGEAIRIVSGSTSGGAELVVSASIHSAADLKGKTLSSPQLGNTQDIALRWWLEQQGYNVNSQGGGDVKIVPQDNASTLTAFEAGRIDGAWEPEPWATRLVLEGKGHVLVDERSLWPGGQFTTVMLVVRSDFLAKYPTTVQHLLQGQLNAIDFIQANSSQAQKDANAQITSITGKALKDATVAAAWPNMTFTMDPLAATLKTSADHAFHLGLLKTENLTGIYSIKVLNDVLVAAGRPTVVAS